MKALRMIGLALVAVLMSVNFSSCKEEDGVGDNAASIVGTWVDVYGEDYLTITFYSSNTWSWVMDGHWKASGTYSVHGNKLDFTFVHSDESGAYDEDELPVKKHFDIYLLTKDRLQFGNDGPSDPDYDLRRK